MSTSSVPLKLTIDRLQAGYRKGQFTPDEVIDVIVQRAEKAADKNIWILPPSVDRIRPYLDHIQSLNPADYPLWGIPFAVKDNIEVAGWPITAACPEFAYTADHHAAVVDLLIQAGAIPVGKTNLDQFATGLVGTRSPYGETHNAFKPELISGGSSSGSAVAVALGQAAFALGTDTAGSGRVPAALNGIIGYKPAVGAWPIAGVIPACRSIDCVTVFAHTVDDAEAVDRRSRMYVDADPYSFERPLLRASIPDTFLIPEEPLTFYGPYASAYEGAWERAKEALVQTGRTVKKVPTAYLQEAAAQLYEGPLVAERWADLQAFVEENPGATLPVTETILRTGEKQEFTAAALFRSQHRLTEMRRKTEHLLQDAILVMPTVGGTWMREEVAADPIYTNSQMGLYTNHCNLLDLSAIAIPAFDADKGLPFGITLFSLPKDEANLGATAKLFQRQIDCITVAVCGLHMRGMALEQQMVGFGATFMEETQTAPHYELYKLATAPPKPGLLRVKEGGSSIKLELWSMPASSFGPFTALIPAPLGIGKIELVDGRSVSGFVVEAYGVNGAANVSSAGGWRNVVMEGN